ncbi:hypothetical protein CFELI_14290 [Corynebacterium felinum]|uniref:Uncharacterized protein n=1 Tax=Corynebacterium felinum TaxID=131318 RepID=A0ABU2B6M5_9CORY|nr:hypothetical protein [Corynebacterium felinum]WJY96429.1 hypothetical protein CFELI_14290 [Corynebacterium felinum]
MRLDLDALSFFLALQIAAIQWKVETRTHFTLNSDTVATVPSFSFLPQVPIVSSAHLGPVLNLEEHSYFTNSCALVLVSTDKDLPPMQGSETKVSHPLIHLRIKL